MSQEAPQIIGEDPLDKILRNYTIKPGSIDSTIKFAEENKGEFPSVLSYLMTMARYTAESRGIEGLPVILGAVWKIERDVPEEDRRLTSEEYLSILTKGEQTSAIKERHETGSLEDSVDHADRATTLLHFLKQL